jgi:hypothetical protein
VQGDWLWVSREATGWITKSDVDTPVKAVELFSVQIGQNACNADAFVARGNAKLCDGRFDDAIEDYNESLRLNCRKIAALTDLAVNGNVPVSGHLLQAGTKLVATGNFQTVQGQSRTRLFVANLTGSSAILDLQSSILNPRFSILHPHSFVRLAPSRFEFFCLSCLKT